MPGARRITAALAVSAALALAPAPVALAAPSAQQRAAAKGTASLGLDLLPRLGPATRNVALSPNSIAVALAMAGVGARGTTAGAIARVLHLPSPAAFGALGDLQRTLRAGATGAGAPQLDIADGLFVRQGFQPSAHFTSALGSRFGAPPQPVDFATPAGLAAVNAFVRDHTQGLIPKILDRLDPATRLVLANALYLKAQWVTPFDTHDTRNDTFHARSGSQSVPFMHLTATLPYASSGGTRAVALPYRRSSLQLLVVLPAAHKATRRASGAQTPVADLRPTRVALSLPRFRVHLMTSLVPALRALGMGRAFGDDADFSGITTKEGLRIDQVAHAADIAVDEAGTVAAAATAVTISPTAVQVQPPATRFAADRPFLFFLRDTATGAVLFAGRLADAAAAPGPAPVASR